MKGTDYKCGDRVRVSHEDDYTKMLIASGQMKSNIGRTGTVVGTRYNPNMAGYGRGNEVIVLMDDTPRNESLWCDVDLSLMMSNNEACKWCEKLSEAKIGDIVTIGEKSVKVLLDESDDYSCKECPFASYDNKGEKDCTLNHCDCAVPCSFWNNAIGKRLKFATL